MNIIFATANADKLNEIKEIMQGLGMPVISMKEAEIFTDVAETGATFRENAAIKARAIHANALAGGLSSAIVMADDSGLEIDYLNKEPGVYSARYLGTDTSYRVKNQNLIDRLAGVPDERRSARFVCAVAAVLPSGELMEAEGLMEGRIAYGESGDNGFGYDPIFFLPEYNMTSASLPPEVKNAISHRGKALREMKKKLENLDC
ncbi:MAG: RdgB/HAM1 family non-canonical purine NTP pyrophosphatase [Lachnospiraceae bacterium]|jgi:XTP/dITP diphosphohydrolase|nr:RdgB/HAM1 family non-canonical purine NTP pyrophosphatase [Lachnospiraceae bacterium]